MPHQVGGEIFRFESCSVVCYEVTIGPCFDVFNKGVQYVTDGLHGARSHALENVKRAVSAVVGTIRPRSERPMN